MSTQTVEASVAKAPVSDRRRAFSQVTPKTSFHCGLSRRSIHGKCYKLAYPISIKVGGIALPFKVVAVSESGIPLVIDADQPIFYGEPVSSMGGVPSNDDPEWLILIQGKYFFVNGSHIGSPVRAYHHESSLLIS